MLVWLTSCGGEEKSLEKQFAQLEAQKGNIELQIADLKGQIKEQNKGKQVEVTKKNVTTFVAKTEVFNHFVEVQGNVVTDRNVMVTAEMAGRITSRKFNEGQFVKKGQVLATVDTEILEKNLAELESRQSLVNTIYEKQKNLWDKKIGSEIQFLKAKNDKEALEKSISTLNAQIKRSAVIAPISGVVEKAFLKQNEIIAPGMPLAQIVDVSTLKVKSAVSEIYTKNIKRGKKVMVEFPSVDIKREVAITRIGQFINLANRTLEIEMNISNSGGIIKPNAMAIVRIKDFEIKDAITIPTNLVQKSTDGETFIYTLSNDGKKKAKKTVIETGKSYKGKTIVTKGLTENMTIISKGYNEVYNGEEVNVVSEK